MPQLWADGQREAGQLRQDVGVKDIDQASHHHQCYNLNGDGPQPRPCPAAPDLQVGTAVLHCCLCIVVAQLCSGNNRNMRSELLPLHRRVVQKEMSTEVNKTCSYM